MALVLSEFVLRAAQQLAQDDPWLTELLEREHQRQQSVLMMVASSSVTDPSTLVCGSSAAMNVTAEGYPGARYHAGCEVIDEIEQLAIDRARLAFGAEYANVQPHSASAANQIVMCRLLSPGDTLLGMNLESGGHLTHGAPVSISGQYFRAVGYGTTPDGAIDYEQVARQAHEHQPRLIICGTTAYPRILDFARFRQIADEVGAYLLADISHISALVIAGEHPSPIDHAHFTTTCTHKQLYGPRGGLILIGRDHQSPSPDGTQTLAQMVQRAVFPFLQGAPNLSAIAAKARALGIAATPSFRALARLIVRDAQALADAFLECGCDVVTGRSDNHMVVLDVRRLGITGWVAERALQDCGIIVNKNRVPNDRKSAVVTSGIRLGTNSLARRGFEPHDMRVCAQLVYDVLTGVKCTGDREYELPDAVADAVGMRVQELCERFPLEDYIVERPISPEALRPEILGILPSS